MLPGRSGDLETARLAAAPPTWWQYIATQQPTSSGTDSYTWAEPSRARRHAFTADCTPVEVSAQRPPSPPKQPSASCWGSSPARDAGQLFGPLLSPMPPARSDREQPVGVRSWRAPRRISSAAAASAGDRCSPPVGHLHPVGRRGILRKTSSAGGPPAPYATGCSRSLAARWHRRQSGAEQLASGPRAGLTPARTRWVVSAAMAPLRGHLHRVQFGSEGVPVGRWLRPRCRSRFRCCGLLGCECNAPRWRAAGQPGVSRSRRPGSICRCAPPKSRSWPPLRGLRIPPDRHRVGVATP